MVDQYMYYIYNLVQLVSRMDMIYGGLACILIPFGETCEMS